MGAVALLVAGGVAATEPVALKGVTKVAFVRRRAGVPPSPIRRIPIAGVLIDIAFREGSAGFCAKVFVVVRRGVLKGVEKVVGTFDAGATANCANEAGVEVSPNISRTWPLCLFPIGATDVPAPVVKAEAFDEVRLATFPPSKRSEMNVADLPDGSTAVTPVPVVNADDKEDASLRSLLNMDATLASDSLLGGGIALPFPVLNPDFR